LVVIFKAFGASRKQLKYLRETPGITQADIWAMAAQVRNDEKVRKYNWITLQNILNGERASADWYDQSCWEVIPEKIRQAGGLVVQGEVDRDDSVCINGYTHHEIEPIEGCKLNAEQAWQSVRGQIQMEMPQASFNQYLRDVRLIGHKGGHFILGVSNQYAVDWLTNRLSPTVVRLLSGICNMGTTIEFVAMASKKEGAK
jgi:hypothetical protein